MKPVVLPSKIHLIHKRRVAIRRAQYVCSDFKKNKEDCKVAWDQVEELTKAIHKEDEKTEDQKRTEKSQRIYDC
jgi:hypothetical protein